jgi:predicted GIY-YIG superfamily endonuclease
MNCAVYTHFDHSGSALYVGCTENPKRRTSQHKRGSPWWGEVKEVLTVWYATQEEALLAESRMIERLRPPFNRHVPAVASADEGDPPCIAAPLVQPSRERTTPVPLTEAEREEIRAAMKSEGIRSLSDFLRIAALRLARGAGQ